MFKHILAIILFSVIVVAAMPYAQMGIQWLISGHDWISDLLKNVFAGGEAGNIGKGLIALLCIPLVIGLIPTIIFWLVKRRWFPYFMNIVWVVWLLQVGALLAVYKAPIIAS